MSTPLITALHIGVNKVDPKNYDPAPRELACAEADALALAGRTTAAGLTSRVLVGPAATRAAVLQQLELAAETLKDGALFVLTFSGHGAQDVDGYGPRREVELDGLDEVWCLADDFLLDDELYARFARFAAGVRVLVIADCCHAGGGLELQSGVEVPADWEPRSYPHAEATRALEARAAELKQRGRESSERSEIAASVILFGACPSDGYAFEDRRNGVFTGAVCALLDRGEPLPHRAFVDALRPLCRPQVPVYEFIAPEDPSFEAQMPLTVAAPIRP